MRRRLAKKKGITASGKGLKNIDPLDLPIETSLWVVEQARKKLRKLGLRSSSGRQGRPAGYTSPASTPASKGEEEWDRKRK